MALQRVKLPVFLIICQVAFIFIFAFLAKYGPTSRPKNTDTSLTNHVYNYYPMFQDVHVMVFVGFGFIVTFLKRYGYSAVGLNFLVATFVIQWTIIIRGLLYVDVMNGEKFIVHISEMFPVEFCAATVLISFGVLFGKISPLQFLVMAFIEVILIQINEMICKEKFYANDPGGGMLTHAFGAYFGLAASRVLYTDDIKTSASKEGTIYHSDIFSMIGTIFLWVFWPSFNAGALQGDEWYRAVLNTLFSLASSCVLTFALSAMFNKRGKFEMVHIQNATLAGGVAVGTCANMNIEPWGALLLGALGAIVVRLGFLFVTGWMARKLKMHDTCGVNNLHGLTGILAAIAGAIAAAFATEEKYGSSLYDVFPAMSPIPDLPSNSTASPVPIPAVQGLGRTAGTQAAFQIYALLVSLGISIVGGIVTGAIMKIDIWDNPREDKLFDDENYWTLPEDNGVGKAILSKQDVYNQNEQGNTHM